jgi:hypothetical protein
LVQVRVGHDHHVVFGAAQGLHALAVARAHFIDVVGNGRGAHKRDGLHVGVDQERVHRVFVALHHVEHACGQARLLEQLGHQQAGAGVQRAGLEHKGVARRNGHREHPHGHHHRKVKGRDAGHHAQGLAKGPVVYAGGDLVGEVALEQLRDAAGKFHNLNAARDLALRVGEHLAVLGRDQAGQLVFVRVEQLQKLEHHPRAAQRRGVGPGRKSRFGRGHGGVHVGAVGQPHLAADGAGGGVEHVLAACALACSELAGDKVSDLGGWGLRHEKSFGVGQDFRRQAGF